MSRWVLLFALAGCDKVLGLQEKPALDAPANGHDEDSDGVADFADTCPTIKGPQKDTDGDHVGDLCDPDPSMGGDMFKLYTFELPNQPDWDRDGSWTYADDEMQYVASPSVDANVAVRAGQFAPPFVVESRVVIDSFSVNMGDSAFSIVGELIPNPTGGGYMGISCSLFRDQMGDHVQAYVMNDSTERPIAPFVTGTVAYTMKMTVKTTSFDCDVQGDNGSGSSAPGMNLVNRLGLTGFEGRNIATRASYFIIYYR